MKPSCKRLNELIKDEVMAVKEYKSYGYIGMSKDEEKHLNILRNIKKGGCK